MKRLVMALVIFVAPVVAPVVTPPKPVKGQDTSWASIAPLTSVPRYPQGVRGAI